jgi:hypothetical protein
MTDHTDRGGTAPVVLLVIGIPGAGKTTLIDRACSPEWTVVDTDRFRRGAPAALRRLPVPYALYVADIIASIARHRQVVVQSRGTYRWMRRLVVVCARRWGREAVLVMLDAPPADAVAGQVRRGRVAPGHVMRWHITRWSRLLDAAGTGALAAEGWTLVLQLDRAQASRVGNLAELTWAETPRGTG